VRPRSDFFRATKLVETHISELAGVLKRNTAIRAMLVCPNGNGDMCSLCHIDYSLKMTVGHVYLGLLNTLFRTFWS
jgi:hypothetical protein